MLAPATCIACFLSLLNNTKQWRTTISVFLNSCGLKTSSFYQNSILCHLLWKLLKCWLCCLEVSLYSSDILFLFNLYLISKPVTSHREWKHFEISHYSYFEIFLKYFEASYYFHFSFLVTQMSVALTHVSPDNFCETKDNRCAPIILLNCWVLESKAYFLSLLYFSSVFLRNVPNLRVF